jgi:NADH:ubiquinone oxidoreductase subunit 5 (subunit L)/multisubunit Na+/H+ antiporter MnhA subunit
MNAKLSLQMTLLGLGVMVFYAGLLASGLASLEILPHYTISALIFLCSGRLLRQMAANLPVRELQEPGAERLIPDWSMRTAMLNWIAAGVLVTVMAAFLVKPPGMSFIEMLQFAAHVEQMPTPTFPMP